MITECDHTTSVVLRLLFSLLSPISIVFRKTHRLAFPLLHPSPPSSPRLRNERARETGKKMFHVSRSPGKMRVAVVQQFYETRVIDEFVLRGNTATLKCLVPSFVADFVDVIEWLAVEDGSTYSANSQEEKGTSSLSLSLSSRLLEKIFSETAMSTWASFPSLPPPPPFPPRSINRTIVPSPRSRGPVMEREALISLFTHGSLRSDNFPRKKEEEIVQIPFSFRTKIYNERISNSI